MPSVLHIFQYQSTLGTIQLSVSTVVYATCASIITLEADVLSGKTTGHTFLWTQLSGQTVTFITSPNALVSSFQQTAIADDKSFSFIVDAGTKQQQTFIVRVVATPTDFVDVSGVNKSTTLLVGYGTAQLPTSVVLTPDFGQSGVAGTYPLTQLQWNMNTAYNPYGFMTYKGTIS